MEPTLASPAKSLGRSTAEQGALIKRALQAALDEQLDEQDGARRAFPRKVGQTGFLNQRSGLSLRAGTLPPLRRAERMDHGLAQLAMQSLE